MNTFRKHNRNLAKHSFNSFTRNRNDVFLPWLMLPFGFSFSGNHQFYIFSFQTIFFIFIVCVCAITIKYTALRKIKEHIFHSIDIMIGSWQDCKFYRNTIDSRDNLDCKTIKVFSQRGFITSILIPFNNPGTGYSNILTNWRREAINNVFRANVYFFDDFSNVEKQINDQLIDSVYSPVKTAFTEHSWH